jgi:hypothetical protein
VANSAQIRSDLAIFLQSKCADRVKSILFNIMPTLEFFLAINGDKKGADGLGRPQAGMFSVGRINEASAPNRAKLLAERVYLPILDTTKPDKTDVKNMTDHDSDPTVPNWDTTNRPLLSFKQPRFKFSRKKMPYKVAHSDVRTVKRGSTTEGQAAKAVGEVYDIVVKKRTAVLCEVLNDELFGINSTQGYPTDEDAVQWDHIHSIQNALKADNTYGGLDRSLAANSHWRGNYDTTARTSSFSDLIDYANYDLGMIDKGLGVQLIAVGKTLFKKAKAEAKENSYQLMSNGIPEFPEFGFKREIVRIYSGNRPVYVYYEPAMESAGATHAAFLDPSTWTIAIHPDNNFKVSVPSDQTKNEGGDEADTGTIGVELLICCEVPKGNAYFTNLS